MGIVGKKVLPFHPIQNLSTMAGFMLPAHTFVALSQIKFSTDQIPFFHPEMMGRV